MNHAPTCRTCYAHSLPDDERRRFLEAPLDYPPHYCPTHAETVERLHALAASLPFIKAAPLPEPAEFPRCRP